MFDLLSFLKTQFTEIVDKDSPEFEEASNFAMFVELRKIPDTNKYCVIGKDVYPVHTAYETETAIVDSEYHEEEYTIKVYESSHFYASDAYIKS